MKKDPKIFFEHIMDSILLIEEYTKDIKQAEFVKNISLQDFIIRRLEIIGEMSSYSKAKILSFEGVWV